MRIVYALPGNGFGCAQLSDFQLAADLGRRGHRTTLCFESLPGTVQLRVRVQRDRLASGGAAIAWHVGVDEREAAERQQGAFARLIAGTRPTLAILSLPWPVNGLGLMCALERSGTPALVRFHAARSGFEPSPLALGVPADSVRRGDHRVGVSDSLSRCVEQIARVRSGAVSTIRNGAPVPVAYRSVSRARDDRVRAGLGARPSEMMILTVGRLSFEKGVREYPEVVERLLARELRSRLACIGDGPARRWLGDELRTRGIAERVTLTGWLDDVFPSLAATDAFAQVVQRLAGEPRLVEPA